MSGNGDGIVYLGIKRPDYDYRNPEDRTAFSGSCDRLHEDMLLAGITASFLTEPTKGKVTVVNATPFAIKGQEPVDSSKVTAVIRELAARHSLDQQLLQ